MEAEERDCKNIIKNCHSDYILFMDNFLFTSPEMLWEISKEIKNTHLIYYNLMLWMMHSMNVHTLMYFLLIKTIMTLKNRFTTSS